MFQFFALLCWFGSGGIHAEDLSSSDLLSEVRILIDTSGSMSESDPQNFRAASLRMLAKILPENSEAGVWIFDLAAQNILPMGKVNQEWISSADDISNKIDSEGLRTNIQDALEQALVGWTEPDFSKKRVVILLTDGLVDVSEDPIENREARARILDTLLPALQKSGAIVHTVALSEKADLPLLEKLSMNTDGLYQKVLVADDLQRVFLKIYDHSFKKDTLPIEENKFLVDKSVSEVTLLVFRKQLQELTKIKRPSGKLFYKYSYPSNVSWYEEGQVDLVTIEKPEEGTWTIIGNVDPDNRVIILSDLLLEVSELPANIFVGESFKINAKVTEKGEVIKSKEVLNLLEISLETDSNTPQAKTLPMYDNGRQNDAIRGDGTYSVKIGPLKKYRKNPEWILKTTLTAKTFKRQVQQAVHLLDTPITVQTTSKVSDKGVILMSIDVKPNTEILEEKSIRIKAITRDNTDHVTRYNVERGQNGVWTLKLSPNSSIGQYETKFKISAKTNSGRQINLTSAPVILAVPKVTLPKPPPPPKVEMVKKPEPAPEPPPGQESSLSPLAWILIILSIVSFNVLLGLGGFVIYYKVKKGKNKKADQLAQGLEDGS